MTAKIGAACQIVGDDLLVTNPTRVQKAIDEKACNALLLKVRPRARLRGRVRVRVRPSKLLLKVNRIGSILTLMLTLILTLTLHLPTLTLAVTLALPLTR
jgi:hypothetical protein